MLMGNHIRTAARRRLDLAAIIGAPADIYRTAVLFLESVVDERFTAAGTGQPFHAHAAI
jgi:hypothetical protein